MESMNLDNIPDPNKNQNRVPFGVELTTLRTIRAQKQQLADNIATQLSLAKEVHDGIQARYDKLLKEMEAIHSELTVSRNYIGTLEKHRKILQEEDDELAGLLHPIRRCPEEILRTIFEHATSHNAFQTTTTISHVCRSWRAAAVGMGSLWKSISISVEDDIEDVQAFLERTYIRTRSFPLKLDITDIGNKLQETTQALIECLKLDRFEAIDCVCFSLTSSKYLTHISPAIVNSSLASTKCVQVLSKSRSDDSPAWDCIWLIKQSKIERLELHNLGPVLLTGNDSIPSLLELHLTDIIMPTLALELPRLVELVNLTVTGKFRMNVVSQDINMPKLVTLKVLMVRNFPWSRIIAPQLQNLSINEEYPHILPLIRRHPSIRHLYYSRWVAAEDINDLAIHLINVEKLGVCGHIGAVFRQIKPQVPFPPFPKLTELTTTMEDDYILSSQDVEEFVESRCSHNRPKEQNDLNLITQWKIMGHASGLEDAPWRTSPLFENCEQVFVKYETWALLYLSWSPP